MDFKNVDISLEDLPNFEEVNFQPISKKYGWIVAFNWFVFSLLILTGLLILNIMNRDFFGIYFKYILSAAVLFLILNYIVSYFAFFKRKFALRTHDIIYQHGLIKSSTIIIPFNRIQHVDLEEGWLSRVFDIKSIAIFTAGQNSGDIKIPGLEKDISEKINQLILNKIKLETEESEPIIAQEIAEDES